MKKFLFSIKKHRINIITLLLLFFSSTIVSNVLSNYQMSAVINSSLNNKNIVNENNYHDFMAHYYDSQSDWLNKWLTILGILLAFSGIAIPLMLNASYEEKFKELQNDAAKYKKASIEQENKFKSLIHDFYKNYDKKNAEFEQKMKMAIQKAETESIILKINALEKEAERYESVGKGIKAKSIYEQIIQIASQAQKNYSENKTFCQRMLKKLEDNYFMQGLFYYGKKQYSNAILRFEKCRFYNKQVSREDTPILKFVLLECYILEKRYNKALEILEYVQEINREELDGTSISSSHNYFELLKNDETEDAKKLLLKLEEKVID